ncbi:MAG TPA: PAS domain S-box protein [Geminicoccaceae bacterium]|nr:PAS domain S-box protein [Geminicoccaceae bacterium]
MAEALLAAIVESSGDAIASKTLDGIVTSWNKAAERLFGYTAEEMIGHKIAVLAAPGQEEQMPAILERLRRGERVEHFDTVRRRKDGTLVEISLTVSPVRDATGRIVGASKIARDISERRAAERHRQLLLSELDHRVRNTLAVVQAIALQTMRPGRDPERAKADFLGRLHALAETHTLLSQGGWLAVGLRAVAAAQLDKFSDRVDIVGDEVHLTPRASLTLGMVLYELASNALKHGALGTPQGRVEIAWRVEAGTEPAMLHVRWRESGGPAVPQPRHQGLGRTLIERSVGHELGGRAELVFAPGGLSCDLWLPVATTVAAGALPVPDVPAAPRAGAGDAGQGDR